jgi:hypothetical protein
MNEEITVLEGIGTWDLVSPPPHIRPIVFKWIYNIKSRLMLLFSVTKLALRLLVFSRVRVVITMRHLLFRPI